MNLYPKIGIRPIIDGRYGGTPVQCCISEVSISGSYEASLCEAQFTRENVCATLSVTPCWCYGSETFDLNPYTIKAV